LVKLLTGDIVPVQLDAGCGKSAGEAVDEADSVAQCSFTSRLMLVTAENGIVSPLVF